MTTQSVYSIFTCSVNCFVVSSDDECDEAVNLTLGRRRVAVVDVVAATRLVHGGALAEKETQTGTLEVRDPFTASFFLAKSEAAFGCGHVDDHVEDVVLAAAGNEAANTNGSANTGREK